MAVLPELARVADTYKQLAQLYIVNGKAGWKKPPYDEGTLYNRVGSFNNASNMILVRNPRSTTKLKIPNVSFSIALQYAPPGATYGKFIEEGYTHANKTTKVAARPFAQSAADDPLLRRAIDNAMKSVVDNNILPVIKIGIDRAFKRMQTKK
jgi:hypothetical protein